MELDRALGVPGDAFYRHHIHKKNTHKHRQIHFEKRLADVINNEILTTIIMKKEQQQKY